MLSSEEIRVLGDTVGPEWVCTDPCMMDTYSYYMNPEIVNQEGSLWLTRPEAVVMPANTREVSEVVRLCNRLNLMVKPISTGWSATAAASRDRVIVLDLKRMDRIIEIDVKNQIAVVEPYVKAIILQTILWKEGLNLHVVSCGGNHSPLASTTSAWGTGLDGPSMSYSGRNLLGVEWVLPTGDVLILGSAGEGAGWFTADGPGPSLRGIVRGYQGAFGSLGVFTKAALKLYQWDGPPEIEVGGCSPHYIIKDLPSNIGLFMLSFPDAKAMVEAGYRMGEAGINYADFRLPAFMCAIGSTDDNLDLKRIWETGLFQKIANYIMITAVIGYSPREFEWKMKAFRQILSEVGGVNLPINLPDNTRVPERLLKRIRRIVEFIDDPLKLLRKLPFLQDLISRLPINKRQRQKNLSELFWVMLRHANNTQGNFRPSQAMLTTMGTFDTWDLGIRQSDWIAQKKQEYIKKGLFLDDGGDLGCGGTFEQGHMGYLEGITLYSSKDPRSVEAAGKVVEEAVQACIDEAFGIPIAGFGQEMNAKLGPHCGDYHKWMKRIKEALDPNLAVDPFFYVDPGKKTDEDDSQGG
ncbi:MAG: FAD-binding oxidoreductase [Deltaproteobacteria bacterium]|nr:MAG: FAD-binding oxidoreductase [Deltaproteobacteria bacterium]